MRTETNTHRRPCYPLLIALLALTGAAARWVDAGGAPGILPATQLAAGIGQRLARWQSVPAAAPAPVRQLGADSWLARRYQQGRHLTADVVVLQGATRELFTTPTAYLSSGGDVRGDPISVDTGREPGLPAGSLRVYPIQGAEGVRLLFCVYLVGRDVFPNSGHAQVELLRRRLLGRAAPGAVVVVAIQVRDHHTGAALEAGKELLAGIVRDYVRLLEGNPSTSDRSPQ